MLLLAGLATTPLRSTAQTGDGTAARTGRVSALFKAPHVEGELIVKLRDGADKRALEDIESVGLRLEERLAQRPSIMRVRAGSDAAAVSAAIELSSDPRVEYVEPNYLYRTRGVPNDPSFDRLWGLDNSSGPDVAAVAAWDVTTGSDDVVVGVIDSGVDYKHPDLAPNMYTNTAEVADNDVDDDNNGYVDDVYGWDAIRGDGKPLDEHDHGTHVAGTIGARGDNAKGVVGVSWRVKILPLRFINADNRGTSFDAIECIDYAVAQRQRGVNIRVLNNSWGFAGAPPKSLVDAIGRANAVGILFVCAAGNDRADIDLVPDTPSSCEAPNVIAVGSHTRSNLQSDFSNYGKTSVDIFAPGSEIYSTLPNGRYGTFSGTSMASPHVAGVAALIAAAYPNSTAAQLKARLLGSAVGEEFAQDGCLTNGRLDAFRALRSDSVGPGQLTDFRVTAVSGSVITVAWTAVGEDGFTGGAAYYDIRWSLSPITAGNFESATQIGDARIPLQSGQSETAVARGCFPKDAPVHVAMRVYDSAGNFSQSAAVVAIHDESDTLYGVAPISLDGLPVGSPLGLHADDAARSIEFPFEFPFFGGRYRSAYVSTNGLITFLSPVTAPAIRSEDLGLQPAIAPLWFDLVTSGSLQPGEDVYVDASSERVVIRWVAEPWFEGVIPKNAQPVNVAAVLHADGRIDFSYGPGGNSDLNSFDRLPVVGITDGACTTDLLEGFNENEILTSAPAVSFRPFPDDGNGPPDLLVPELPTATEGRQTSLTVSATDENAESVTLSAALPRNATFDPATGEFTFTPDSAQAGYAQVVFTATDASGHIASRSVAIRVLDDAALPEVISLAIKRKLVITGSGFKAGSRLEIDGSGVPDAKPSKKSPTTKIVSADGVSRLASRGLHVLVIVNPDGVRSGPVYVRR